MEQASCCGTTIGNQREMDACMTKYVHCVVLLLFIQYFAELNSWYISVSGSHNHEPLFQVHTYGLNKCSYLANLNLFDVTKVIYFFSVVF